jgi:pSer/pThr/pTyr-binding forkhead associated (FHA) protein
MAAQFQLVMRSGPTPGKIFPLEAEEVIVGRDATSGVAIIDAEVSRKHAKLILHGSAYTIQDLGSTNGTFVNQQRITATQALNPGDTVSFGEKIILQYEAVYDPNATMVSGSKQPVTALPVQKPAQTPAQAPAPVYSGQVPSVPTSAPAQPKKKRTGLIIGIILVILVLVCLCVVLVAFFAPQSMLCAPGIRTITNLLAPMVGYGVCP